MTAELRSLLPDVLRETKFQSEQSLNATIGGKAAEFIDLHHEVILSPDQYVTLYMKGFKTKLTPEGEMYPNSHRENFEAFKASHVAQRYFILFLKRSFLKHFDELTRKRPHLSKAEIWIGQNNAEYGILISPRFNKQIDDWENDQSEIRHFPQLYWTIGHVLKTGLVISGEEDKIEFDSVESYLKFFRNVIVRGSGSMHEREIAKRYMKFVLSSEKPSDIPLLIPEYRYGGKLARHKYRLDFTIINPYTMQAIGYELSPWSTHGYLKGTKTLTQKKINEMAKDNFEKEMSKHKSFFKKHDIYSLIYTDNDLSDLDEVFADMRKYLQPVDQVVQLDFNLLERFFE